MQKLEEVVFSSFETLVRTECLWHTFYIRIEGYAYYENIPLCTTNERSVRIP